MKSASVSGGVLTRWTTTDMAFVAQAVLSEPIGRPLLVAPHASEVEPAGTLRRLKGSSGSGAGRRVDRTV